MELINRIGLKKFCNYLEKFHLTTGYKIDYPGEGKAVVMPELSVTAGDLLRMGFGQSIAITPLGLISSVSAIANGGTLMQPYFVKKITDRMGNIIYTKQNTVLEQIVNNSVSSTISSMLEEVVSKGGGQKAAVAGYDIAGKTGTAQKYENGAIAQGKYVASFIGYAPFDNPDYIVLVVVDEPKGAYYGGTVAAPIAGTIFERIFKTKGTEANENLEADRKALEANIEIPNLTGMTLTQAVQVLNSLGLQYLVQGDGNRVTSQISPPGTMVCSGDVILLIFE